MDGAVLQLDEVSKRFRRGPAHDSLRDLVTGAWRRVVRIARGRRDVGTGSDGAGDACFWALRRVGLRVEPGEAMGIIGPNGAGKSTALKLVAGILRPDEGRVSVRGRLSALIEVGAGFHGDLTGRENVFLNGAILGMGRAEVRRKFDDIVAFAGLEAFIDTPVKRYSSGMYARLGFSIAAHVDPDILLVDEVLSVGDAMFRLRCIERMRELVRGGTALVLVTHNLDQLQTVCSRALVLDGGRLRYLGGVREAVGAYHEAMSLARTTHRPDLSVEVSGPDAGVTVEDLRFIGEGGRELVWCRPDEAVRARLTLRVNCAIDRAVVELNMRRHSHENLLSLNSGRAERVFDLRPGRVAIELDLPSIPVSGGQYFWNVRIWDAKTSTTLLDTPFRFPLVFDDGGRGSGLFCIPQSWRLVSGSADREVSSGTGEVVSVADGVAPVHDTGGALNADSVKTATDADLFEAAP